jgi:flagellar biosynthesis/type III secretory pathway chaperone
MNACLSELAGILEQEVAIAEELERNLSAQRHAIIEWNMDALLAHIEARAPWLRRLDELERKRIQYFPQSSLDHGSVTLGRLLATLPVNAPERERLTALRGDSQKIFRRLQADERHLHELMENLLAHIHDALNSLLPPATTTYGETGVAELAPPATALLHGRA